MQLEASRLKRIIQDWEFLVVSENHTNLPDFVKNISQLTIEEREIYLRLNKLQEELKNVAIANMMLLYFENHPIEVEINVCDYYIDVKNVELSFNSNSFNDTLW